MISGGCFLFQVHLLVLAIICQCVSREEFFYAVGGFKKEKPEIANLILIFYFLVLPYYQLFYTLWKNIHIFAQITEAQLICTYMHFGQDLLTGLVKVYKLNRQFPGHDYWYTIFNGERRPLTTLVHTLKFKEY